MPDHAALTDPFLHEPKGIAAAAEGLVYVSDGAGSGDWKHDEYAVAFQFTDVSSASSIYVPILRGGTIKKIIGVLSGAVTTANTIITIRNAAGLSMGTITIDHTTSGAGVVYTLTPTSNNIVATDSFFYAESDGGSSTAQIFRLMALVEP